MSSLNVLPLRLLHSAIIGGVLLTLPALSQQVAVSRDGSAQQNPDPAYRVFDAQHLKDVPYNGALPKPAFTSTDRVQRTFTVEYVYDYAISTYQPAVELPIVSPLQAKKDTPEAALIALDSAARTGNYEAFVDCFDDAAKARLQAMARDQKQGAAYWQSIWKQFYGNKPIQLLDRVETAGYVILDTRFNTPTNNAPFPNVFKFVGGKWLATDDLGQRADQMLMTFRPPLAGEIIRVQPTPAAQLAGAGRQQIEAQQQFLKNHDIRNSVTQSAQ